MPILEQVIQRGVAGSRPAATAVKAGTLYYSTDTTVLERSSGTAWESYSLAPPSQAYPVGSLFLSVVATNPNTLLGYGTWSSFGAGRVLVGLDSGDTDFDVAEETGGAKTVASAGSNSAPAFTGSALGTHSHGAGTIATSAHAGTAVSAHTGAAVAAHSDHTTELWGTAALGDSYVVSSTNHTAHSVTQPSAHSVTQPSAHSLSGSSEAVSAGTPAGSVAAPTFTGSATSVVQPYIVTYFWKRTA